MKKFGSLLCSSLLTLSSLFSVSLTPVSAAALVDGTHAVVDIDTTAPQSIKPGMYGINMEGSGTPLNYQNQELADWTNQFNRMGYIRYPGGTNTDVFNWKTGTVDEEYLGQFTPTGNYYTFMEDKRTVDTLEGHDSLADFRDFIQKTGSKAMITVNIFQQTPEETGDLAKYCYDNHIPVIYFELGNEVSLYTNETSNIIAEYRTGHDYLDRMRAYDTAIKANYPGAKTVVSMENQTDNQDGIFDADFKNFSNPFWDGITFHLYQGGADCGPNPTQVCFEQAMESGNLTLSKWHSYLQNHYEANLPDPSTPIYIGEFGTALHHMTLLGTHYHGLFLAESILRLTEEPNVTYIGGPRMPSGINKVGSSHSDEYENAYQKSETVNTNHYDYNITTAAIGESVQVVVGAVNQSSTRWATSVSGGATVNKSDGTTMPALYADAYKGDNGKNYVVIVNKSDVEQQVTINSDGIQVSQSLTKTYVTGAADSSSIAAPTTISTANPVTIPAYSVTRVEWTRSASPEIPEAPWIVRTDVNSQQVNLQWIPSINATGYKVKYGTSPTSLTNVIDAGNFTTYNVTGLTNGSTYYFGVTAYNGTGESSLSNNGNALGATLAVPASSPVITNSHPERSARAQIEWSSVAGATGYKLKYGTAVNNYTTTIDVGNNLGYIVEGLTNNTAYYFVVSAYNGLGETANSANVSVTPSGSLPLAPNDLVITAEHPTDVTLNWTPTLTQKKFDYFEDGDATGWNEVGGTWSVVTHTDGDEATYMYQSPNMEHAISVWNGFPSGDLEGEARVLNESGFGGTAQVGVIAGYSENAQGAPSYYLFVYNPQADDFRIVRVKDGGSPVVEAQIARSAVNDGFSVSGTTDMTMRIYVHHNENGNIVVEGKLNDLDTVVSFTDTTPLPSGGKFGLYANHQVTKFDGVRIRINNADKYKIYRSTQPDDGFVAVKTKLVTDANPTQYTDSNLDSATSYYYYVTAVNDTEESYGHSNVIKKF
jgi:hypothetical protein